MPSKKYLVSPRQYPLVITTGRILPGVVVNVNYHQAFNATGGTGPYTWALIGSTGLNSWTVHSNGEIFGTPTNGEIDTVTVSVQDAVGNIAIGTFSITVTSVGVALPGAPRLGGVWVNDATFNRQTSSANLMTRFHVGLNGFWGAGQGALLFGGSPPPGYSASATDFVRYIKTNSGVGTRNFRYYIPDELNPTSPEWPALGTLFNTLNSWLYVLGTTGSKVPAYAPDYKLNATPNVSPVNGLRNNDTAAKFVVGMTQDTVNYPTDCCPGIDGFFHDNCFLGIVYAGDWHRQGISNDPYNAVGYTPDSQVNIDFRGGVASGINYVHNNSSYLLIGNIGGWGYSQFVGGGTPVNWNGLDQIVDGGLYENWMGGSGYIDAGTPYSAGFANAKSAYQFVMAHVKQSSNRLVLMQCGFTSTGFDFINRTTAWQGPRFQLCTVLQDDGYFTPIPLDPSTYGLLHYDVISTWMDEWAVDVNDAATGAPALGSSNGYSYLGPAIDLPWAHATNFVNWRRYSKAGKTWIVFCNPPGNGPQTISYSQINANVGTSYTGFKLIQGTAQSNSVNTGATNQASVTIPDRGGLIARLLP